jgi:p-aminobenzoyl-glutamate transporter AbgT
MTMIDKSHRIAARVAGISGLLSFAIVVFGNYVLLGPLIVAGNAGETARNIVAHQTQVRLAIVCFLSYSLTVVVLLAALYLILKSVDPLLALLGALFRFVFAIRKRFYDF